MLLQIGRKPEDGGRLVSTGYRLLERFLFLLSFAFFGVIFRSTGGYLVMELTKELVLRRSVTPFWPFALIFSILFVLMVYYPIHARLSRFGLAEKTSRIWDIIFNLLMVTNGFLILMRVY